MSTAIEFHEVSKTFPNGNGGTLAVDRLSFSVPQGSVYGLLGANGAGKTTSIRMLVSHLRPDSGTLRVLGHDPADHDESVRQRVAYISENMQLPSWMSIPEASKMGAKLYPKWNPKTVEELTARFRLDPKKQYHEYSKGQRRAMCILLGLAQNAEVLILDEPASGLDTLARRDFLTEILDVACEENRTILFSSHILGDIERIVDRVAILKQGQIIVEGELESLKENVRKISVPGRIDHQAFSKVFRTLNPEKIDQRKQENGDTRSGCIVLDYSDEKMKEFLAVSPIPDSENIEIQGLNLEDLFVEAVR